MPMTEEEFRAWLRDEVGGGRLTQTQMADLVKQQSLFVARFGTAEVPLPSREEYRLQIVGYVAEDLRVPARFMR
jgi:hypothetical protein